jgi:hypothetical protein
MKLQFFLLIFPFCLQALEFKNIKISHQAKINESEYTAIYSFVNNSQESATIEKLTPSCNCIAPKLAKKIFKKGEKGTIALKFDFRNRRGPQTNRLLVYLKGQAKPITLVLEVNIPNPYAYSKRFLMWKGEARDEQKISMTLHEQFNAEVSIQKNQKKIPITYTFKKISNHQYSIQAQPEEKCPRGRYRLNLSIQAEKKAVKISTVYFLVQ